MKKSHFQSEISEKTPFFKRNFQILRAFFFSNGSASKTESNGVFTLVFVLMVMLFFYVPFLNFNLGQRPREGFWGFEKKKMLNQFLNGNRMVYLKGAAYSPLIRINQFALKFIYPTLDINTINKKVLNFNNLKPNKNGQRPWPAPCHAFSLP